MTLRRSALFPDLDCISEMDMSVYFTVGSQGTGDIIVDIVYSRRLRLSI